MMERFQGCLLGLALGDALGAPYEGGVLERTLWRLLGTTSAGHMRWTDDTQMALDLTESLIALGMVDADDIARRFATGYRWRRGYGPGAAKVLKRIGRGEDWRQASRAIYPEGSYGNGGAMRAPVIGLVYADRPDEITRAASLVTRITHAHPLAIEGAVLVARATALAFKGKNASEIADVLEQACQLDPYRSKMRIASAWLARAEDVPVRQVVASLGNGIAASESCVTALYVALRFLAGGFVEMQGFIAKGGGDTDTIGSMAGAIWGASRGIGDLPQAGLDNLEQRERLLAAATDLYRVRAP